MSHTVIYVPSAEQELADAWLAAPDRAAVARAAHVLDQRLARDPANVGESRPGGRRIAHEAPLGLLYRVDAASRTVHVLRVWLFRTGPRA